MAQNVTVAGASYSDVPSVELPKTGGGTALFADPSITTAIAADVASGKQFLLADGSIGTGTASGGGGSSTLVVGALRPDAELVKSWTYDKMFISDGIGTFPSYSTSTQTVIPSADLTPYVVDLDGLYDYIFVQRSLAIPTYSSQDAAKGKPVYFFSCAYTDIPCVVSDKISYGGQSYSSALLAVANVASFNRLVYLSSNTGTIGVVSSSTYGVCYPVQNPTASIDDANITLTPQTPSFVMRGHGTYLASAVWSTLTDARLQYVLELYRAKRGNMNIDGFGHTSLINHIIDCAQGTGTLT